jgi:hypothetical protein
MKQLNNYRIPLCQQSHVLEKSLFCCGKVRLLLRNLVARSAAAAGRTAAFPFSILHVFALSPRVPKKKNCNDKKK